MEIYKLTMLQYAASRFLIINYQNNCDGLIVAVCGAGKTEMCFPLFSSQIKSKKIAFAIPRIDICNQIYTRLCTQYGDDSIGLHHGTKQINLDANLLVLTTNQLLKYKHYFDLIIIDEVDAFPFDVDPTFYLGVTASLNTGSIFYLTSTPSPRLLAMNLPTFTIYKRWHNYPLPSPILIHNSNYLILSKRLKRIINRRNRKLLIFVATITKGLKFSTVLNKQKIEHNFSYSTHPKRAQILSSFTSSPNNQILLTTTILERGVTFNDIDVLIIDSDDDFYTTAALVQIAGRVNRKLEYQNGAVYFSYKCYSKSIKAAKKFIATNNKQI